MSSSRVHIDLYRAIDALRDLDSAHAAVVGFQPPTEAPADQVIMERQLFTGSPAAFAAASCACNGLIADPNLAAVLARWNRAVHRLHRRMSKERKLISRLDLRHGLRHGGAGVADILRDNSRSERRLLEFGSDFGCVEFRVRPIIPFDYERRESLLRRAHVGGDDRYRIVELDNLKHALDGFRRLVVDGSSLARRTLATVPELRSSFLAAARRCRKWRSHYLRRRIEPLRRRADEFKIFRLFESNILGDFGKSCGVGRKLAIGDPLSCRRVEYSAFFRATGCGETRQRFAAAPPGGFAVSLPRAAAVAKRRVLHLSCRSLDRRATDWRRVSCWAARAPAAPGSTPLSSSSATEHRDGGVSALAHLDIGHCQNDLAISSDSERGVWLKRRLGCVGFANRRQV